MYLQAKWISRDGRRADIALAYLHDKKHGSHSSKLKIITGKVVVRVLFEIDRAVGVELCDATEGLAAGVQSVKARKQVVLSAGAFGSPEILERSGIGSRQVLDELGIKVIVDLPGVGTQYMNHHVCEEADMVRERADPLSAFDLPVAWPMVWVLSTPISKIPRLPKRPSRNGGLRARE